MADCGIFIKRGSTDLGESPATADERTALDGYPAIADAVSGAGVCAVCYGELAADNSCLQCGAPQAKARSTADADIDAWIERLNQRAYQDARADGYQAAIAAIERGLAKAHPGIERIDKWAARLAYIGESGAN